MKTKLKPCPFCSSLMLIVEPCGWVFCDNCGANGPASGTKREAIAAWNRRAEVRQDTKKL